MTTAAQVDTPRVDPPPAPLLLGPVLGTLPADLFLQEVLRRLGPRALASLAGAARGCAAAVAATALMQWAKHEKMAVAGHLFHLLPLCVKEACTHAAFCGNREVLEWLHDTGCPWDATTYAAADGGHLEVLQWAREHDCPWDSWTCVYAARSGHLLVLQWAREHGCPWSSLTPVYAALGGHLEVLQWVRANDSTSAVWNENVVRHYSGGRPREQEVLRWLDELIAP